MILQNLKAGQFVGIVNCVGVFPVISRQGKNLYNVLFSSSQFPMGIVTPICRNQLVPNLKSGKYLFLGQSENFIKL